MPSKISLVLPEPPDQHQRDIALDPRRSVIVQAPAGSGKTDLLTRRFLRLLAEVSDPRQVVAITFTRAAAAEMRHRILDELEKAAQRVALDPTAAQHYGPGSMERLAAQALAHSEMLNWRLIELSSQLRISTIDSFCRDLAIQQPIHSGIGNNLQVSERPAELYAQAARATLEKLGDPAYPALSPAIRDLLLWRDNGWKELEQLLVGMLRLRDRWMLDFVLRHEQEPDALRERLERPMATSVNHALARLEELMTSGDRAEAHELAQFACSHGADNKYRGLAEVADFPAGPYADYESLEEARGAYLCLANMLLKNDGEMRQKIDARLGFPREHLDEKLRMEDLLGRLADVPGLEEALAQVRKLPPARYTEEDWQIIRAIFVLLRHAAAELKTVFAEAGTVDFVEVAQIAKQVLRGDDNLPSDAAQAVADDIHHLLVDEFQDTSRRQHEFITALIEAWPDSTGRSVFVVGDPMQSIYFFRDAEAELFGRVKTLGFELSSGESFPLYPVALSANFRTDAALVSSLNDVFAQVFAVSDGSGIQFAKADPARAADSGVAKRFSLHLAFVPQAKTGNWGGLEALRAKQETVAEREAVRKSQLTEIVTLIRAHLARSESARAAGRKYRLAVLGRARTAFAPVALTLREAGIPFRAVELEGLRDRQEIIDAVALTRALFNPQDRVAWLGVLRAPWCGLNLEELHTIAGTDTVSGLPAPVPELTRERAHLLSSDSRRAAERVLAAVASFAQLRTVLPVASIGTLIQQIWQAVGGDDCVDDASRANLDLFWGLLDHLPNGEQDVVGPALDAALESLCAMPDPSASGDYGIQLMTIHKSKGLEFEVVIVPDLQAQGGRGSVELLSWLERGLLDPGPNGELTEFLIAPVQYKGTNPGAAKRWVDRARRDRETQEMRRILYVAATRAREELHLFAQPSYKLDASGTQQLAEPSNSLLATAWPALADEIRARFEEWTNRAQPSRPSRYEGILPSIAAGQDNVIEMPSRPAPTILRRLPPNSRLEHPATLTEKAPPRILGLSEPDTYSRHEGGIHSRILGNAVHKLLEQATRLRLTHDWNSCRSALQQARPRLLASIRAAGVPAQEAEKITTSALDAVLSTSRDSHGQWILSPHLEAATESGWAGLISGDLHQIRVDRIFRAGPSPLEPGDAVLWIVDYKTAHVDAPDKSAIPRLRETFAPQLAMYATILRNLHGSDMPIRAGLYYPRMAILDWWEA